MRSKELWLVQENHATVKLDSSVASRGMKTYSESRIELRTLQILEEILDKSSHVEVALKIEGVEQIHSENLRLQSTWRPFDSSFKREERY